MGINVALIGFDTSHSIEVARRMQVAAPTLNSVFGPLGDAAAVV